MKILHRIVLILMTLSISMKCFGQLHKFTIESGVFLQYSQDENYDRFPGMYVNFSYSPIEKKYSLGLEYSYLEAAKYHQHYNVLYKNYSGAILVPSDTFYDVDNYSSYKVASYMLNFKWRLTQFRFPEVFFNANIGDINLQHIDEYTKIPESLIMHSKHYLSYGLGMGIGIPIALQQRISLIWQINVGSTTRIIKSDGPSLITNYNNLFYSRIHLGLRYAL